MVIKRIAEDPRIQTLAGKLDTPSGVLVVSGLWGSSAPLVAAKLADLTSRPLLYITAHVEQAENVRDDLEFFLGRGCELFSAFETLPGEGPSGGEIHAERLRLLLALKHRSDAKAPMVVTAPIQALLQPAPSDKSLDENTLHFAVDQKVDPDQLAGWLADRGFARLELVESPGDFARRGDILDVFAPGETQPVRIEFFDDTIESIRRFDVSTQRSIGPLDRFVLAAAPRVTADTATGVSDLADYLPPEAIVVIDAPGEVQEMGRLFRDRLGSPANLFDVHGVFARLERFKQVHLTRLGGGAAGGDTSVHFDVGSVSRFEGRAGQAADELIDLARDRDVVVVCENAGEKRRLTELLIESAGKMPPRIELTIGYLHRGFDWTSAKCVVVAHHEVFSRMRPPRRIRRADALRPIEQWMQLQPGDVVVHSMHGIARFREMKLLKKGDSDKTEEYLALEFAEKAILNVPVSDIDLVQKYVGAGAAKPRLSKLGGTRWSKTKQNVTEAVAELAESLLRIQAAREAGDGTAYPDDTTWQREFEDAFVYQETEDQLIVAEEIKSDLRKVRPMDRLLCGDVGYGKTELSMRAAFKVVEFGRQVAVLVPTTVLAEQHYRTFRDRMADYPFAVGCLSRFRSPAEQRRLIEGVKKGRVDIVIGTHRLLSKDVNFADLGLVVIDEEQRFGVEHKERLKTLRDTVDVLTMTATPIPRTLHMAMIGIRDISSLATPPVDRRSIATQVRHFDENLIRSAILREINRDGQVYFVHNRVQSIASVADKLRKIVPECKIVYGHGQMSERELEGVMRQFVNRKADVLVATTIIESGIDIPTANTIFINDADRFGLADLHQLRGRVGRSEHRAYCYLLVNGRKPVQEKAARRLKSIEEFSELGAGFQIAMRDLEIRGAGNLLGPQQSGHIAAVGYDLYCRLLEDAVRKLRSSDENQPVAPVHLELGIEAFVPRGYMPSERARIDFYRRTVGCRTPEDLERLQTDLTDAFGEYPPPVQRLVDLAEIRMLARRWDINSIQTRKPDIVFKVAHLSRVQPLFDGVNGTVRMPDPNTIHLRLRETYFEPPTLLAYLRKILAKSEKLEETPA